MDISHIIEAISRRLQERFGDAYKQYTNEMPQTVEVPAFFIQLLKLEHTPQMSGRAKVKLSFDVQYFPLNGQVDVANHALRIQQALSEITLSDETVLLAKGAYSEMLDGIAHNFMDFDFLLQDREERTLMESLYTKGRIDHH
ncbi:DUF6838 family protein [Metasolibacillus sp. FSL H7-0170]|uniref:phage tail terminator family protein n=1 Tax=Metasolibacillus TaxID=2703677 RepID=UPI0007936390|nr:hypothetical protein [Metasolibacillus fluoroglycofenilyticus]KYG91480.1 hypothetical protein A0U40_00580 [[Bacillus] sp. KCTC 13219]